MKRLKAEDMLFQFLKEHYFCGPGYSDFEIKTTEIKFIFDFLEKEIGMRPPIYKIEHDNSDGLIYWTGTVGDSWEPEETSDRERDFQSKKDSCI